MCRICMWISQSTKLATRRPIEQSFWIDNRLHRLLNTPPRRIIKLVSQKKGVTCESAAVGRVGIVTAPENPYNSSSLLRNHQVCNTIRAEPSSKSTSSSSSESHGVIYLLRLAYLAWGSISPGLAEDLHVACGSVAVSVALSRMKRRGINGDSRWTMFSVVRVLPSASSYLSLVASPSTKTRVLQAGK